MADNIKAMQYDDGYTRVAFQLTQVDSNPMVFVLMDKVKTLYKDAETIYLPMDVAKQLANFILTL